MNKKLTAAEILEIVSKHYSVDSFAYEAWTELQTDEFQYSEETQKLVDERQEIYEKMDLCYTTEYQELRESLVKYEHLDQVMEREVLNYLGLGVVETVDRYGGSGKGETYYVVKHFVDHNVYIRTDGWYSSYRGAEFEEGYGYEVFPKQVTVTKYEATK